MTMTFGVQTGQQNCSLQELRELWRFIDGAGFDWISVWDHFYESPPVDGNGSCFDAIAALTLLAADTVNVRVGCLVLSVGYRHPAVLAKALATIDHVSYGRLEAGLGAGWHEPEYRGYGIPFPSPGVRHDQLDEGIQVIRSLLTQDSTSFTGKYFQLANARCNPKPVQKNVPIWVGGVGEKRTLQTAARYADGWNAAYVSPEVFRQKSAVLDQWCDRVGRDPATIARTVNVGFYMKTDAVSARAERERFLKETGPMAEARLPGMFFGTAQEVADHANEYREAGAARVALALRAPFDREALQSFVADVMPMLR